MKKAIDYTHIADLYDTYVDTAFDIPFFLKEAKKTSGEVLELMSGTGRVSIPLIEAGIRLTCIDNSPEMLAVLQKKLKQRCLSADMHEINICKMSLDKEFELIFIPFHSFAELLSPADQRKALRSIHQHLSETGHFICTLHNPAVRLKRVNGKQRLIGEYPFDKHQRSLFLRISENYNPNIHIVNGLQIFEIRDNKGIIQSETVLKIQFFLHTRNNFEELVKSEGFKVIALYGDYSYAEFVENSSPFMIWILQK